jgi:hypothetical protein
LWEKFKGQHREEPKYESLSKERNQNGSMRNPSRILPTKKNVKIHTCEKRREHDCEFAEIRRPFTKKERGLKILSHTQICWEDKKIW